MAKRKGGVNAIKSGNGNGKGKGKMKGGGGMEVSAGAVMPMPMPTVAAWWASPWFILFAMALAIIAFLSYLLWQKSQGTGEAKTTPIVVMSPSNTSQSSVPTTNHNLPINPQRDPKYPLRNTRSEFQQMGVLIAESAPGAEPTILPLIGKPAETHRDRWKYYTATDRYHMMRLPVNYQEKNCQEDVGCQEIYDGDTVSIPAYKDKVFTAQIYKYEAPRYDPSTV